MFSVEHLTFRYDDGTLALDDVSLEVPRGSYAVLLGANGSGKSTLARHLNGLLRPTSGRVLSSGLPTDDPRNVLPIRARVGMVFQNPDNQIVATTVADDVAFGLENLGLPADEIERRVDWALEVTGLLAERERPPHMLSGGQKQRLAIAGAVAMRQEALILDEATSSLDSAGRREVRELVQDLHRGGVTVLAVTHRMEEALDADRVFVLSHGRVALQGRPREVFAQAGELRRLNLAVPDVAAVSAALHAARPAISGRCLTSQELLEELHRALPAPSSAHPAKAAPPLEDRPCLSAPPVAEVRSLAHTYLRRTPLEHIGLRHADLTVREGAAVAIVGPTGSGKSTVMQHLNGILRPDEGQVRVVGVDLAAPRPNLRRVRLKVGMLFQNPEDQLFEQLVGDDVAYGPFQAGWPLDKVREHVRWAMQVLGLDFEALKDRPVFSLSGGEKRRVALAGVLALRPDLLVLDEPTAGLDPRTAQDLLAAFARLRAEGVALVFVTHNLDEVLAVADEIVILQDGRTMGRFATEELLRSPEVLERHGFDVPALLELQRGLRGLGYDVAARRPSDLAAALLEALEQEDAAGGAAGWARR